MSDKPKRITEPLKAWQEAFSDGGGLIRTPTTLNIPAKFCDGEGLRVPRGRLQDFYTAKDEARP
jgi:hypothetical protein